MSGKGLREFLEAMQAPRAENTATPERARRFLEETGILVPDGLAEPYRWGLSGKPSSTIGFERRFHQAFAIGEERAFVDVMLANVPPPPPEAVAIRARNAGHLPAEAA